MYSVTQQVRRTQQPHGGYLPLRSFQTTPLDDGQCLFPVENIRGSLIGLSVDYLTRFMNGTPVEEAFAISLMGASTLDFHRNKGNTENTRKEQEYAQALLSKISGLDDKSILHACKLVGYDVCYRAGTTHYRPVDTIEPDSATINNIRIMVRRSLSFLAHYGPVVKDGFTFEGGYTRTVSSGDGDFITRDTMWDFKVLKNKPSSRDTLQLLMYYLMGRRSIHPELQQIQKLGFFNPRSNIVYLLNVSDIPAEVISKVENDVICYPPLPKAPKKSTVTSKTEKKKQKAATPAVTLPKKLYPVGTQINHPTYGIGTVIELKSAVTVHYTRIRFGNESRLFFTSALNRILGDS